MNLTLSIIILEFKLRTAKANLSISTTLSIIILEFKSWKIIKIYNKVWNFKYYHIGI